MFWIPERIWFNFIWFHFPKKSLNSMYFFSLLFIQIFPWPQSNLSWMEKMKNSSAATLLNWNEFVISSSRLLCPICPIEWILKKKRVEPFSNSHAIDVYKFCITFECENILKHRISITNSKPIYLTFWCLNGLDGKRRNRIRRRDFLRLIRVLRAIEQKCISIYKM